MLIAFVAVQLGINAALLILMAQLLRERAAQARQARDREERLEALAVELCAVARELTRQETSAAQIPRRIAAADAQRVSQGIGDGPAPAEPPYASPDLGERVRGATALLEQGLEIEKVAAETALLPGEVQVLRNLRRRPFPTGGAPGATQPHAPTRAHRVVRRGHA
jgi:hypothetical protein